VQLLVDIVVKGGNLLLNIGPAPDGTWPEGAYRLLGEIGKWMKTNGEAIYGTRAMAPYKDGKVCINRKGDGVWYVFYMADEGEKMPPAITMKGLTLPQGSRVTMPGTKTSCSWQNGAESFTIKIPAQVRSNPPSDYVWVMKVEF
jgi:alpha-L-fucosidase